MITYSIIPKSQLDGSASSPQEERIGWMLSITMKKLRSW